MISYEHLYELQRFAELGRMSASLLHEIKTPLTAALINLELSGPQSAGVRRAHNNMRLLRRYVEAARQQVRLESDMTNFAVRPHLQELKHVLRPLAVKAGVKLCFGPAPDCRLYGDPVKFQHIVTNLAVNAIEACSLGSNRQPMVKLLFAHSGDWLVVEVMDRGPGIPDDALPHVFEAFYTSKGRHGRGLGIGLSIVHQYVTAEFRGHIRVRSSAETGTCFKISLPVVKP